MKSALTGVHNINSRLFKGAGAITFALMALVLPACESPQEVAEGRDNVTTEDLTSDDVTDVTEDTGPVGGAGGTEYESVIGLDNDIPIGETVTVRSPVQTTVGDENFALETDTGEPILVINNSGVPLTVPGPEIPVQVTGEVVQFVIADVESEYGLDLDEGLYIDYEQQPAIIAESIAPAPRPEDLAEDATQFYNQRVAIEGEIGGIYSPETFSLFEEGWIDDVGLLVVGSSENLQALGSDVQEGETVTVTGTVQPFDINLLQEYELGWDEAEINEFESRYTNRPVIVAEEVYPSALEE